MNDATRQLVLLVGVMTILIAGFVTMNVATTDAPEDPSDTTPVNATPAENKTADNTSTTPVEQVDSSDEDSNATTIVGQSIHGLQALWEDFNNALEVLPMFNSTESDS